MVRSWKSNPFNTVLLPGCRCVLQTLESRLHTPKFVLLLFGNSICSTKLIYCAPCRLTTESNITLAVGLIKDLWLCWKMEWSRLGIDLLTNMTNTVLSEVHLQHSGYQQQHTNYPKLFVNILGLKRKIQTISPR